MTPIRLIEQSKFKALCFLIIITTIPFLSCLENTWCAPKEEKLKQEINEILQKYKPYGSRVGISIFSISKNKPLYEHNLDKTFVIASNMKLFTTATALVYLGADFEYKTRIYYRGSISPNGELNGDIIIKGSGGPDISGRAHNDNVIAVPTLWAESIKKHGIKVVTGDIVADDSIFDREFICDDWPKDQLSKWYCAPVSGLSFNDNCINIKIKPNERPGTPAYVQTDPRTSYVTIINNCKTTTSKTRHYSIERKPLTNQINIKGHIWSKSLPHDLWVTIYNPPLYTATVFKEILENMDVRILGKPRVINTSDLNTKNKLHKITETTSQLRHAIKVTNKRSQGFYAEQILKTLGAHIGNEGSFIAGLSVIKRLIKKLGFSEDQYQIADGSGLSKKNNLSPRIITRLLRFMYHHKHAGVFIKSLPVSGVDGTLKKRLKKDPFKSRVKAKTGYVSGVSTLSGYVKTLNDEIIAFSILVNKIKGNTLQAKNLQNAICRTLVTHN